MRQLEHIRNKGASYKLIRRWFDVVSTKFRDHHYDSSNVWNIDESGFGIGEEQTIKVLIHLDAKQKHKVVGGKQEQVIDIKCISAAGEALAPFLIFKGTDINARQINKQLPQGWYFVTSKNSWTLNDLRLAWLKIIFDPLIREKAVGRQRLLIADGHRSYI